MRRIDLTSSDQPSRLVSKSQDTQMCLKMQKLVGQERYFKLAGPWAYALALEPPRPSLSACLGPRPSP